MPILDVSAPFQALPNRGRSITEILQAVSSTSNSATQTLDVGTEYAGGVIIGIDPEQGYRVRMPDGKERYVPANVSTRLQPYLKDDGTLDVVAAVKAGVTDPIDYAGWNVNADTIKTAQQYDKVITNKEKLKSYIGEDGSLDLPAALKSGYTSLDDYTGWNVTQDDLDYAGKYNKTQEVITRLAPYKSGDGYDIYKAVKAGATKDDLQTAFGLTDTAYQDYVITAPYITYDSNGKATVDLQTALDALNAKTSGINHQRGGSGEVKTALSQISDKLGLGDDERKALEARFSNYALNDSDVARLNALAGKDSSLDAVKENYPSISKDELANALEDQFGVTVINENGVYSFKSTSTSTSSSSTSSADSSTYEARELPAGIDQGQIDTLQTQLESIRKQEAELAAASDGGLRAGTEENAMFNYLRDQELSVQSAIAALKGYQSGDPAYDSVKTDLTAQDVKDLITQTDPILTKYITINPNYTGKSGIDMNFDLITARKDGLSDDKLKGAGFTEEDLKYADAYIKVTKFLPDGVISYDAIALAEQAGLDAELKTIGVTEKDINTAISLQRLADKGYVNKDTGMIDVLQAQSAGMDQDLAMVGYTPEQIADANRFNQSYTPIHGYYYANTDLADLKMANLSLYNALVKDGQDGYQVEYDRQIAANKAAKETLNKFDGNIYTYLDATPLKEAIPTLQALGYSNSAINDIVSAQSDLKNYNADVYAYAKATPAKEAIPKLQTLGYSNETINNIYSYNQISDSLQEYKEGEGYWIEQYIREHPDTAKADLKAFGYDEKTIEAAAKIAELAPNYLDWMKLYSARSEPELLASLTPDELASYEKWKANPNDYELSVALEGSSLTAKMETAWEKGRLAYEAKYGANARLGSEAAPIASFVFQPARALAPDVTLKDIGGLEWGVGGAQIVLMALPFVGSLTGKVVLAAGGKAATAIEAARIVEATLSAGATGIFIADQSQYWSEMSTSAKAMSIGGDLLTLLPIFGYAASKVHFAKVTMDVKILGEDGKPIIENGRAKTGKVTIYKGLTVNEKPVLGKSGDSWIVGNETGKLVLPEKAQIVTGYKPVTQLETEILANRKSLLKMGWTEEEIARMEKTLIVTQKIEGVKSKYTPGSADYEPVRSLSKDGVATVIKKAIELKGQIKEIYGSLTVKQQLADDLKNWRELGDIDVMTNMTQADAEKLAAELAEELKKTEGAANVRVNDNRKTLIDTMQTKADGTTGWDHAVDIHTPDEPLLDEFGQLIDKPPSSKGREGAYGLVFDEPTVKIAYPDGTIEMMALSESGKRKMASLLEWNSAETDAAARAQELTDAIANKYGLKSVKASKVAQSEMASDTASGQYEEIGVIGKMVGLKDNIKYSDLPKYTVELTNDNVELIVHELVHANFDDILKTAPTIKDDLKGISALSKKTGAGKEEIATAEHIFEELADINITNKLTSENNVGYKQRLIESLKSLQGVDADGYIKLADSVPDRVQLPDKINAETVVKELVKKATKEVNLKFDTPSYRTKDVSDYYVIVRTLKGKELADDWAKAWGYDPSDLLAAQERDPLKISKWVWKDENVKASHPNSKGIFTKGKANSPAIYIQPPKNLPYGRNASPTAIKEIEKIISSPSLLAHSTPESLTKLQKAIDQSYTKRSSPASKTLSSKGGASKSGSIRVATKNVYNKPPSPKTSPTTGSKSASANPLPSKSVSSKASSIKPYSSTPASKPTSSKSASTSSQTTSPKPYSPATESKTPSYYPSSKAPGYSPSPYSPPPYKSPGYKWTGKYSPIPPPPRSPKSGDDTSRKTNKGDDRDNRLRPGDFAWRQGLFWIRYRPKPSGGFEKTYSRHPFEGAIHIKRTPNETIFVRGSKDTLPAFLKDQMGIVNVEVTLTGVPKLHFREKRGRIRP